MKNAQVSKSAETALKECQNIKLRLKKSKDSNDDLLRLTDEISALIYNIGVDIGKSEIKIAS